MTVKVGGKTYKGKYPGPDQFKGDKTKIANYYAAQRKTASKPAPKPATPAPKLPAITNTPAAPNLGAVGSNSTGNLQLQTNADIESQALEAHAELAAANEQAAQMEQAAIPEQALGQKNARDVFQEQRGQSNAQMAFRGMRGSAAVNRSAQDKESYRGNLENVNLKKTAADTGAANIRTQAQNWFNTRKGQLELARQGYTNEQSRNSPTIGTTPINSGLKATTPYTAAKPAAAKTVAAKTTVKAAPKKYKGKYPGPDKFKGDKKKLAVYNAAKRKAGKK